MEKHPQVVDKLFTPEMTKRAKELEALAKFPKTQIIRLPPGKESDMYRPKSWFYMNMLKRGRIKHLK